MMTTIDAMKQALESAANYIDNLGGASKGYRMLLAEAIACEEAQTAEAVAIVGETWCSVNGHEQGTMRVAEWVDENNPPKVGTKLYTRPAPAPTGERAALIDKVMEQAQVFASSWALVGSRFDRGDEIDNANEQKADLRKMVADMLAADADSYKQGRYDEQMAQGPYPYPEDEPMATHQADNQEAVTLLSAVFDAWENGTPCYDDLDEDGRYIGAAFQLDDDIFKRCCNLLNRVNPPRNAAPDAQQVADQHESVLIDGIAYLTPTTVAVELLRLHIEVKQLTQKAFTACVERDDLKNELGDLPQAQADMLGEIKRLKAQQVAVPQTKLDWTSLEDWWKSGSEDWDTLKGIVSSTLSAALQPPQERKPMTEREINDMWEDAHRRADPTAGNGRFKFARAIEARIGKQGRKPMTDEEIAAILRRHSAKWKDLAGPAFHQMLAFVRDVLDEQAAGSEPMSEHAMLAALVSIDPTTKRLPPGFVQFARAVEAHHGIGKQESAVVTIMQRKLNEAQVAEFGAQSAARHLGSLVDFERQVSDRAMQIMKALMDAAQPINNANQDCEIPASAYREFLDANAELLFVKKNGHRPEPTDWSAA